MELKAAASRTALLTAALRARDTQRADGVCHDPWAARLAGDDGAALVETADRVQPEGAVGVTLRTRFFDHHVERWTAPATSIRQVVALGAGLDTRAARLKRGGVRFFEVDHPATQADKRRRLAALCDYPVDAARYAACDLETGDVLDALAAVGFAREVPTLVLWEGVTAYLTADAVSRTLTRLADGLEHTSVVVFDYLSSAAVRPPTRDAAVSMGELAADVGEPFRFAIDNPLPLLYRAGFRRVRVVSMEQLCLTLTGTYDDARRMFGLWGIAVASRTAAVDL
jgi:methyltransferase (TIGR00027 family)